MAEMQPSLTQYDLVDYPGYTHPQTHPDRLGVIGSLLGLKPAATEHCRVLELGCGNGNNLVPMAEGLRGSEFVGIDLAARPVACGQEMIRELGLKNVQLFQRNISEAGQELGSFDYILCHGVFSWVPLEVRHHILRLCRQLLAPQGIAFVSYNAFPGCHLRIMLREMMLFHVRGLESPRERMTQAKALVKFLSDAQNTKEEYRQWLLSETQSILGYEDGHLYHDELAEINDPYYFTRFIELAAEHQLQFLGEADYFEMFSHGLPASAQERLEQLGANRLLREQYLDFIKCRRFRQTLLCHREVTLRSEPDAEVVPKLLVSTKAKCPDSSIDLGPEKTVSFRNIKGAVCATDFPLGKAAMLVLTDAKENYLPFGEIFRQATGKLSGFGLKSEAESASPEALSHFLLQLYAAGVVDFRTCPVKSTVKAGERPKVSDLTRWQIRHSDFVTSPSHMSIKIEDEVGRFLLAALDGTDDRATLVDKIWHFLKSKNALVANCSEAELRRKVELDLESNLNKLSGLGLIIG